MKKNNMVLVKYLWILVLLLPFASSCSEDPEETPKRADKEITAFGIPTLELTGVINATANTIALTIPLGYDQSVLVNVVPHIEYNGVKIEPAATSPQNFTETVTYKVTAEDGTFRNYTVTLVESEFVAEGFAKTTEVWAQTDWLGTLGFQSGGIENTIAYKDGKLVVSRTGIILNANTGVPTGAKLNVTGTDGKFHTTDPLRNYPFSLANDDAGNVIGTSLGAWTKPNMPVYKWTSLESAPALLYEIVGNEFGQFGRKIGAVGNINANGFIIHYNQDQPGTGAGDRQHYIWTVTAGAVNAANYTAIEGRPEADRSYYQTLIPMTTGSIYPYYLFASGSTSGIPPSEVSYKANASQERVIIEGFQVEGEDVIYSSKWGAYVYHAKRFDFNGVAYIAVLSVSAAQVPLDETSCIYYLSILDTRNNTVAKVVKIPRGTATNLNGSVSVTHGPEETLPTGEKTIRLYSLFTDLGVYCHELSNKQ
ncbi:MAG: DUF5018 domain-containing protein [Prevotellaceae bacterium]|jgi:hypothetical protein|nr:DUF5018 domain-containing protein [Prevotellaceae bacterium]